MLPYKFCYTGVVAKKNKNKRFHQELATQLVTLSTSGFGLVAALAWNQAIQEFVDQLIVPRIPGAGVFSKLIYAILVTALAVLVTFQLSRLAARWQQKSN